MLNNRTQSRNERIGPWFFSISYILLLLIHSLISRDFIGYFTSRDVKSPVSYKTDIHLAPSAVRVTAAICEYCSFDSFLISSVA